jgi:hypothetical protein
MNKIVMDLIIDHGCAEQYAMVEWLIILFSLNILELLFKFLGCNLQNYQYNI